MSQQEINSKSMLRVGTILRGIYRIDSYLSSGGFGNTYVATNIEFDERVAIKEFFMKGVSQRDDNQTTVSVSNSENTNSFLEQKEKFKKEARRIRLLHNEHIISVHDLFEENGTAYYVMDYVDGENLSKRLRRTGRAMTENEVIIILPQILDALKAVHDAGIWHLDLKPANIMLEKGGNIKLIDFGASKQLNVQKGGATTSTAISYTNGYAPREQMEQNYDKFGPWTDIYALGATIYNLFTNKRPPLPTDIDDDMSNDKHIALPFPNNVGEKMRRLVLWLMQTNRNNRPQSIEEVLSTVSIPRESSINAKDNDSEETIVVPTEKKQTNPVEKRTEEVKLTNNEPPEEKNNQWLTMSGFGVIILIIFYAIIYHNRNETKHRDEEIIDSTVVEEVVDTMTSFVDNFDINQIENNNNVVDNKKLRVEQFTRNNSGIIASYPNDKRYCVYYSKKDKYGDNYVFYYDAASDKSSKMNLPIHATGGGFTDVWVSKNKRFIYVAATYRVTDFIRIDTETNQIKYITECLLVKRKSDGFILVQTRCINEFEAECEAEKEYAYTDYYYDEDGTCIGHSDEYTTSPY